MNAAIFTQHFSSEVEPRSSPQILLMTLSAPRLQILRRKDRLLPRQRAAVRFFNRSRGALPAMANNATELLGFMRNRRMITIRLNGDISEARFLERAVTRGATVDDAHLRQPDLLNARFEMAAQRDGVAALRNQ